ncbi:unnamed protein product, partial [Prorocentrum cordatum]
PFSLKPFRPKLVTSRCGTRCSLMRPLVLSAAAAVLLQQASLPRAAPDAKTTTVAGVPHGGAQCATAWDCALGGVCDSGQCKCDVWFTGGNCTLLNLARARRNNGFNMTGLGWSSWGGHAVPDEQANGWVGLFSLMADKCGLRDYHSNSESIMAFAQEVDGPYTLREPSDPDAAANVAVPPPSHCTQIKRHPSGEYHLWHIFAGGMDNGSSRDPQPARKSCSSGPGSRSSLPPQEAGGFQQQLFIHTSRTPRGPWSQHGTPVEIRTVRGTTAVQASCAAPYYFQNGSALAVWGGGACPQGWGGTGGAHGGGVGCLWAAAAAQWQGPYRQLGGPPGDPVTHPENEDPAIFMDLRGGQGIPMPLPFAPSPRQGGSWAALVGTAGFGPRSWSECALGEARGAESTRIV